MNCEVSNEYLMKYFDGDINDIEEAQFKQHLKTCRSCSEQFNSMGEILGTLESAGTVEPPEDFEARVMEKVDAIENVRREKSSRMLIWLYNAATIISIVLLMVFVADLKQVSLLNAFEKIGQYFGSFSSASAAVLGVVADIFGLIAGVFAVIFEVAFSIVKSYYYIFLTLIGLFIAVQKLFVMAIAQGRREN
jgi:predicted anti-sigma-YlaC factor YlaD